jgi:hypothetical protein
LTGVPRERRLSGTSKIGEKYLDEFTIKSSVDDSRIEFSDRLPDSRASPIESFVVKVARCDLYAAAKVWTGYTGSQPAEWWCGLAENWRGWPGELQWESLEHELRLVATNDRRGHIAIRIQLRSGFRDYDWSVAATVMVDAGQLEGLAKHAISFFGEDGRYQ